MKTIDEVIQVLEEIKPGVDYHKEENLFGDHIFTSLEIVQLVSALNDAFDIKISLFYMQPGNFRSAETICAMVEKVMDED